MPSTCAVTIKNRSGLSQQYILFAAMPIISRSPKSGVFTNIYMTAPTVPSGHGSTRFSITNNFYAVCGTNKTPLSSKVQVSTLDFEAVVLGDGNRGGTTTRIEVTDGAPEFDMSAITPRAPDGAFTIITDHDFSYPNPTNIFIGLGGESGDGSVVPMFATAAHPGQIYHMKPVVKYYIGTGSYVEGEIIDIDDIGTVQLIDFTGNNPQNVVLTHCADGCYRAKSG